MKIEEELLRKLTNEGLTNQEIANKIGVSRATVTRNKTFYNIKSKFYENKKEDKKCLFCNLDFKALISENRKFCSHSCSTSFNNLEKGKQNIITYNVIEIDNKVFKKCLNCCETYEIDKREISKIRKYCSYKCSKEFQKKEVFKKIEEGNTELNERQYKKYLIEKHGNKCMECGWNKIHPITGNIPVQLEHIDGNYKNNNLDNLKLLCPNCHSLTATFGALNKGNGREFRRKQ